MGKRFRVTRIIAMLLVVGLLSTTGLQAAKNAPRMIPDNFSALAEQVSPAVVNIQVEKTAGEAGMRPQSQGNPFGDERFKEYFGRGQEPEQRRQAGLGTGFIIDKTGYIITNNHVVENADKIKVVLKDEREFNAEIVGRDPQTDLALIKVAAKGDLPTVPMGRSADLKVGEWVVAIGNPFGLENTVTAGIVSAKGRVIGSGPYDDYIQTDASINPGNSGGPLLDMNGEVVGINTAISRTGPRHRVRHSHRHGQRHCRPAQEQGEVTRGWLGVTVQDLKGELARYYGVEDKGGVLVADVVAGDPADKAGIKAKDVILKVNGEKVSSSRDLTSKTAGIAVGEKAKITLARDGKEITLPVTVGKRAFTLASAEAPRKEKAKDSGYGLQVADVTPEIAGQLKLKGEKGVVVVGVLPDSKAEKAGMQRGDLIVEVNRRNVDSVGDFKSAIDQQKKIGGVDLLIKRMNAGVMVIHLA